MIELIEYIKIHLISLEQDKDPLDKSPEDLILIEGQIIASRHILSVANDILEKREAE